MRNTNPNLYESPNILIKYSPQSPTTVINFLSLKLLHNSERTPLVLKNKILSWGGYNYLGIKIDDLNITCSFISIDAIILEQLCGSKILNCFNLPLYKNEYITLGPVIIASNKFLDIRINRTNRENRIAWYNLTPNACSHISLYFPMKA